MNEHYVRLNSEALPLFLRSQCCQLCAYHDLLLGGVGSTGIGILAVAVASSLYLMSFLLKVWPMYLLASTTSGQAEWRRQYT